MPLPPCYTHSALPNSPALAAAPDLVGGPAGWRRWSLLRGCLCKLLRLASGRCVGTALSSGALQARTWRMTLLEQQCRSDRSSCIQPFGAGPVSASCLTDTELAGGHVVDAGASAGVRLGSPLGAAGEGCSTHSAPRQIEGARQVFVNMSHRNANGPKGKGPVQYGAIAHGRLSLHEWTHPRTGFAGRRRGARA